MAYRFGNNSRKQLSTCHRDLQIIAQEALKRTQVDFGIHCGWRSHEDQQKAFNEGRTTLRPGQSKHNLNPSMAFDFHAWVNGNPKRTWDQAHIVYIAGVIITTAKYLYDQGKISHKIRWGGNWDSDGELKYDQRLWDPVHIELVK